jgi:hypothetical protein
MSGGYTPVFRSVFTGSLCGQWPDTAAWLSFLALADKNGEVDMTPQYIASVTGMPLADLQACIGRFLEPDPMSRSTAAEGRRLELIDPERPWGWRIVNFSHYREKARLAAKNSRDVESGKEAERKRHTRAVSADVRRSPPVSDPSYAYADSNTDSDKSKNARATDDETEHAEFLQVQREYPPNAARQDWIGAEKAARRLVENREATWIVLRDGVTRYARHCAATNRLVMNPVKFFTDHDRPWSQAWPIPEKAGSALVTWKPDPEEEKRFAEGRR